MNTVTVAEALAELPTESATAVAQFLREKGIKGTPYSWSKCPIANWVTSRAGEVRIEVVASGTIEFFSDGMTIRHDHPSSVITFIRAFDSPTSPYPYLIG